MKKVFKQAYLFVFTLFTCIAIASCSSDDDEISPADLIGTWELSTHTYVSKKNGVIVDEGDYNNYSGQERYVFIDDSTVQTWTKWSSGWKQTEKGTWELKSNTIYFKFEGYKCSKTISLIDSNTLVLSSYDKGVDVDNKTDVYEDYDIETYYRVEE